MGTGAWPVCECSDTNQCASAPTQTSVRVLRHKPVCECSDTSFDEDEASLGSSTHLLVLRGSLLNGAQPLIEQEHHGLDFGHIVLRVHVRVCMCAAFNMYVCAFVRGLTCMCVHLCGV
jgi:hypothetical protein